VAETEEDFTKEPEAGPNLRVQDLPDGWMNDLLVSKPFDPTENRETTRGDLARGLLWLLTFAIGGVLAFIGLGLLDGSVLTQSIFPSLVALSGTALGFYFGSQSAPSGDRKAAEPRVLEPVPLSQRTGNNAAAGDGGGSGSGAPAAVGRSGGSEARGKVTGEPAVGDVPVGGAPTKIEDAPASASATAGEAPK
jgi:hypothetical protein